MLRKEKWKAWSTFNCTVYRHGEERSEMESLMKETVEGWQEMEGKGQGGICGR